MAKPLLLVSCKDSITRLMWTRSTRVVSHNRGETVRVNDSITRLMWTSSTRVVMHNRGENVRDLLANGGRPAAYGN